jgi:hypothetical protein
VLVDAADWLWRPDDAPLDVRFELPAGMAVSAPWPGNGDRFELPRDPAGGALVAIGRLARRTLKVGGARLRVAILDASPPAPADVVTAWVREGAGAVAAAYGCFPVPAPQVLIVPVGAGDDPVPWGQVRRGGGPAVHLFIDQHRSAEELRADWVLVHEFSHLLHPDFDRDSAWLAEGLASFYQNVLRARAGLLAQRAAFKELHAGFARGRTEVRRGVSLVEASRRMRVDRDYMRVYWSGAAISLLLDLAYRAAGSSLDEALFRFRECCLEGTREWSAAAFLAELDRLTGSGAGSALFREYAHADRFPDLAGAYASLGLLANGDGLKFDPRGSRLRNAVMGAARTLCKPGHARDAQGTAGVPPS